MTTRKTAVSDYRDKQLFIYETLSCCAQLLEKVHENTADKMYFDIACLARDARDVVVEEIQAFELTAPSRVQ